MIGVLTTMGMCKEKVGVELKEEVIIEAKNGDASLISAAMVEKEQKLEEQRKGFEVDVDEVKQETKKVRGLKRESTTNYNNERAKRAVAAMLTRSREGIPFEDFNLIKAVKWLISLWQNGLNGILADQMGLGKTIQTIGFLVHLKGKGSDRPYMIIAPLSTLSNWVNEISRFAPCLNVIIYHGTQKDREEIRIRYWRIPDCVGYGLGVFQVLSEKDFLGILKQSVRTDHNGASNHMTGNYSYFSELNENITGRVRYRSLTRKGLRGDQAREICNEDLKRSWYGRLQSSFMSNGTGTQVVKSNQKLKLLNIKKCPRESHARAMKQILRYLKGTTSFGIKFKRGNAMRLVGYSGHNVDIDDGRSTTGYVFYLGTSPITWCSQKQTTVVLSSCEAKFMAATAAACQAIWLREVLAEVTVNEQVIVEHVCEENQRLDPLTKALACIRFKEMRSLLGVQELPSSTQKFRG
ncbi:uncharacterized mitochondrial protein-like protein [Tanacetum coccineum]